MTYVADAAKRTCVKSLLVRDCHNGGNRRGAAMSEQVQLIFDIDQALNEACETFAKQIGSLSANPILREGVVRASICALTKALESEFDGYQDVLGEVLIVQGELVGSSYSIQRVAANH
jgi:hypothetical protein